MSLSEIAERLERSFRKSERLLAKLLASLKERRTSWIAARPEQVQPTTDLESLGAQLHTEDRARAGMVEELSELLPLPPGATPADARNMHVNVSRLSAAIPAPLARRLRQASDEVTSIARRVRRELALGRRLLDFAQRANESLMIDSDVVPQANESKGYDECARARRSFVHDAPAGHLVDGRM